MAKYLRRVKWNTIKRINWYVRLIDILTKPVSLPNWEFTIPDGGTRAIKEIYDRLWKWSLLRIKDIIALIWVKIRWTNKIPTTFACMNRCLSRALTFLNTQKQPKNKPLQTQCQQRLMHAVVLSFIHPFL